MMGKYKTVKSIGMDLPIIAELRDGWFLAAHPNGACIVNRDVLTVLWEHHSPTDEEECDDIPSDVRLDAIEKFERFAWPRLKAEFYPNDLADDEPKQRRFPLPAVQNYTREDNDRETMEDINPIMPEDGDDGINGCN